MSSESLSPLGRYRLRIQNATARAKRHEQGMNRFVPTLSILAAMTMTLAGCQTAALWGNLAALGVTFGLFYGTLQLGRAPAPTKAPTAEAQVELPKTPPSTKG